jgi:prevent-host-death family protein
MVGGMDDKPIAEARANLSELIASVRLLRLGVLLTRRGKPQAALVPYELAQAADAVGGMDAAIGILNKAAL